MDSSKSSMRYIDLFMRNGHYVATVLKPVYPYEILIWYDDRKKKRRYFVDIKGRWTERRAAEV